MRIVASKFKPEPLLDEPLQLVLKFVVERPGKPKFADAPAVAADLDKMVRAVGDALTGVIWVDDSRVVELIASKRFGDGPKDHGCEITVRGLALQQRLL